MPSIETVSIILILLLPLMHLSEWLLGTSEELRASVQAVYDTLLPKANGVWTALLGICVPLATSWFLVWIVFAVYVPRTMLRCTMSALRHQ